MIAVIRINQVMNLDFNEIALKLRHYSFKLYQANNLIYNAKYFSYRTKRIEQIFFISSS